MMNAYEQSGISMMNQQKNEAFDLTFSLSGLGKRIFPIFFREKNDKLKQQEVNVAKYIQHVDTELANARIAYCNSLIEIASHRTEAHAQLIRFNELTTVRDMISQVNGKTFLTMRAELEQYSGNPHGGTASSDRFTK